MLNFKCTQCGGEMSVSRTGDLICSYCGSHMVFSDKELAEYRDFRKRMLVYLSSIANREADPENTGRIWAGAETEMYRSAEGDDITVRYLFKSSADDGTDTFTSRNHVILVFPRDKRDAPDRFQKNLKLLSYPSADIKNLSQYFPVYAGTFPLDDGRVMLALSKSEELFPLSAFGSLPAVHAAWIVSRLENLCCVMEFSNIRHGGIGMDSVFINARTHEAFLLGGWENAGHRAGGSRDDLAAVRSTARRVLGRHFGSAPAEFRQFIDNGPASDAYSDFSEWDRVIERGFGGRKFEKLDLCNLQI